MSMCAFCMTDDNLLLFTLQVKSSKVNYQTWSERVKKSVFSWKVNKIELVLTQRIECILFCAGSCLIQKQNEQQIKEV